VLFRGQAYVDLYPAVHHFRDSRVALLAASGANDEIFGPGGPRVFRQNLSDADPPGRHIFAIRPSRLPPPAPASRRAA
jgi:hypothetical protein